MAVRFPRGSCLCIVCVCFESERSETLSCAVLRVCASWCSHPLFRDEAEREGQAVGVHSVS